MSVEVSATGGTVAVGVGGGITDAPQNSTIYGRKDGLWVDMTSPANLQVNRGTAAEVAAYTALDGEPVWDSDGKALFVGDGSTAGGILVGRRVIRSASVDSTPITSATYTNPIKVALAGNGSIWRVFGTIRFDGIDITDADIQVNLIGSGGTLVHSAVWIKAPAGFSFATANDLSVTIAVDVGEAATLHLDYVVQLTTATLDFGLPLRRTAGTTAAYYDGSFGALFAERLL